MSTLILKSTRLSLLVCTFATIGQSSVPLFPQSNAWQRYKAEGFSVLLPEQPTATLITRPTGPFEKPKTGYLFGAYEDGVVYLILSFDNPRRRESLATFLNEAPSFSVGKPETFDRDLSGAGFVGKQYSFTYRSLKGVLRSYMTQDHVYMIEALGEDVSKPSVNQFLDSFSIGNDDGAKKIPYENPQSTDSVTIVGDASGTTSDPPAEQIFKGSDVTRKPIIVAKPEPQYTEVARQSQTIGTVVLRGVLASNGHVTNLQEVRGLPNGLTGQAFSAARTIKFIPAIKDGRYVSMFIQLEYSFNLY